MRHVLVLLLATLVPLPLMAAEWFVAPGGNDAAAGSQAQPFASIQRGIDAAGAGDTVQVRAGTYALTASLGVWGKSASAGSRITIRGYQGERPIIDGTAVSVFPANAVGIGSPYITFQGFEVRNAQYGGIVVWKTHHVEIRDCIVHHSYKGGISIDSDVLHGSSDVLVENCTAYRNVLENQTFAMTGGWSSGFGSGKSDRVTFRNNTSYNNHGEGMLIYLGDQGVMTGNTVYDTYSCSYYLDNATNSTVEGNLAYNSGDTAWNRFGFPATAFQTADEDYGALANRCRFNTVRNNVFVGLRCAFYFGDYHGTGGSLRDFIFANNTCYGAKDAMLHVDATSGTHSNAVFAGNIFRQTGSAQQVQQNGSWAGITGHHNLWYGGSGGASGLAGSGDLATDPIFATPGGLTAAAYHLLDGSPARDALPVLAAVPTDRSGTARPQGPAADLGAWEEPAAANQAPQVGTSATAAPARLALP
jgi:hypothetical protein